MSTVGQQQSISRAVVRSLHQFYIRFRSQIAAIRADKTHVTIGGDRRDAKYVVIDRDAFEHMTGHVADSLLILPVIAPSSRQYTR
jgi:hypothetical protein